MRSGLDSGAEAISTPVSLCSPIGKRSNRAAKEILRRAAGRPGHIFNLGHGILPETPVESVKNLARFVQEYSG